MVSHTLHGYPGLCVQACLFRDPIAQALQGQGVLQLLPFGRPLPSCTRQSAWRRHLGCKRQCQTSLHALNDVRSTNLALQTDGLQQLQVPRWQRMLC